MNTSIAVIPTNDNALTIPETMQIAEHFARSGYFKDASDVSKAIVKMIAGRELGIGPMTAMTGIHLVQGKPALSAGLVAALIQRSGRYHYDVLEASDTGCKLAWYRGEQMVGESSFTLDEAKKAGLAGKDVWKNYPSDMCFARALTRGARRFCADVFLGAVYVPEELGASVDPATGEVIDVPTRAALPAASAGATNGNGHAAPAAPEPHYTAEIEAIETVDAGLVLCETIVATTTGYHRSGALRKCMVRMADLARDGFDIALLKGAVKDHGGHLLNGDQQAVFDAGQTAKAHVEDMAAVVPEGTDDADGEVE